MRAWPSLPRWLLGRARIRARIAGWEAAGEASRREVQQRGADPRWSTRLSLSMLVAADEMSLPSRDPVRERQVAEVRRTWSKLKRQARRSWRTGRDRRGS